MLRGGRQIAGGVGSQLQEGIGSGMEGQGAGRQDGGYDSSLFATVFHMTAVQREQIYDNPPILKKNITDA